MDGKQLKYENPLRLAELKPEETLLRIGLSIDHTVVDIGAGSGIFTFPAARITKNKVFALEISEDMLAIIADKAKNEGSDNIELMKVEDSIFPLASDSIDIALMVTVLHEIDNQPAMLAEIKRVLHKQGKLAIIEFHKRETPMGPPVIKRIDEGALAGVLASAGFVQSDSFHLGENFYCSIFLVKAAD